MARDVYADLLRETRTMRRDQASARDRWFEGLPLAHKEALLFELEMLLKGMACFANPRNHPGPPRSEAIAAHDYRRELATLRAGLARASQCVRELLGERDRAFVFARYLETLVPEDGQRRELLQQQLTQHTPEESLFVLRNAFASYEELSEGLLDASRVPYRIYSALVGTLTREVGRSAYFNPLQTLEFRSEFDRIRHPAILSALHRAMAPAHRHLALTFLSLFRLLRYLEVIDRYAHDGDRVSLAYLILSVFRSDARALCHVLEKRSGEALARGYESKLAGVPASELRGHNEALWNEVRQLRELRDTLCSAGQSFRLECQVVLERDLPSPSEHDDTLGGRLVVAAAGLRAVVHHTIGAVARGLDPSIELNLGSASALSTGASTRLRRDIWTFRQVLRAFLAKAEGRLPARDRWNSVESFAYVREFLQHFRSIGYQLARRSDYGHLDRFLNVIAGLGEVDLLAPERLDAAIDEVRAFHRYLGELFERINSRAELVDHPFDRSAAADHLRRYLRP